MELEECMNKWKFNNEYKCWCLEDTLYTEKATTPKYQRLSIFVPEAYMDNDGIINKERTMNGYTAKTAPVIFANNSAGYMQMPNTVLGEDRCRAAQYLSRGFIYITCGNRGHESVDQDGRLCGKAPANLIDLKTALRFIRHNASCIPGDMNKIISTGWSAGGAMSTLLGVTGNNKNYTRLLEENGAFMEESDEVFASQIYCPIIDLEHADLSYEWMFQADKENEESHAGPAGVMIPFQEALSRKLAEKYIHYFNSLKLKNPDTEESLKLGADGRSGSGYEYLMSKLNQAAQRYMRTRQGFQKYTSKDESSWLSWNSETPIVSDLDSYILNHRRRMKPCTSFDVLAGDSGENRVLGSVEEPMMHFNQEIADAIEELKEEFPEEFHIYYEAYARVKDDKNLEQRKYLINPLNFIGTEENSDQAKYYRIRVGASDADTSFSVAMTLALKLHEAGKQVDYELVWDQPHCDADYPGEAVDWIVNVTSQKSGKEHD